MRARFCNGPYDKITLYVQDGLDHIQLPVQLMTTLLPDVKSFDGVARYDLSMKNDHEATFQFRGIEVRP